MRMTWHLYFIFWQNSYFSFLGAKIFCSVSVDMMSQPKIKANILAWLKAYFRFHTRPSFVSSVVCFVCMVHADGGTMVNCILISIFLILFWIFKNCYIIESPNPKWRVHCTMRIHRWTFKLCILRFDGVPHDNICCWSNHGAHFQHCWLLCLVYFWTYKIHFHLQMTEWNKLKKKKNHHNERYANTKMTIFRNEKTNISVKNFSYETDHSRVLGTKAFMLFVGYGWTNRRTTLKTGNKLY